MASKEVWSNRAYRSLRDAGIAGKGDGVAVQSIRPDVVNAPTGWVDVTVTHGVTVRKLSGMYRADGAGYVFDWVK